MRLKSIILVIISGSILFSISYGAIRLLGKDLNNELPHKGEEKALSLEDVSSILKLKLEKAHIGTRTEEEKEAGFIVHGYRPGVTLETCKTFPIGTFIASARKDKIVYMNPWEGMMFTFSGSIFVLTKPEEQAVQKEKAAIKLLKEEGMSAGELRYFLTEVGYRMIKQSDFTVFVFNHPVMDYTPIKFKDKFLVWREIKPLFDTLISQTGLQLGLLCRLWEVL